jgi:hypothetical protein
VANIRFCGRSDRVVRISLRGPEIVARRPTLVYGDLGLYTMGVPADEDWPQVHPRLTAPAVRDDKVRTIWNIDPDKFTGSPLRPGR